METTGNVKTPVLQCHTSASNVAGSATFARVWNLNPEKSSSFLGRMRFPDDKDREDRMDR